MADFVAVIRRTVDGLSDNVPEMRAKVYEKARGAVRRQLESMKPRPSDEMIERQMVKLEAAISEVEGDHTVALPPLEQEQPDSSPDVVDGGDEAPAAPVYEDEAPAAEAAVDVRPPYERAADDTQPVAAALEERYENEAVVAPVEAFEPPVAQEHAYHEPEPVEQTVVEPPVDAGHPAEGHPQPEPVYPADPVEYQTEPHPEPEPYQEPALPHEPELQPEPAAAAVFEPPVVSEAEHTELPAEPYEEPVEAKPVPPATSEWELPEWNDPVPASAQSEPVWSEPVGNVAATEDIPDLTDYEPVETVRPLHDTAEDKHKDKSAAVPAQPWAWDDSDPFAETTAMAAAETSEPAISDWSWPVEKTSAAEPAQQKTVNDGWNEIDELLAHGGAASVAASTAQPGRSSAASPLDDEMDLPSRPVSYRVEPKRSRFNAKAIGLSAVVLLMLGGGGYAYWQNQTAVHAWISGMLSSVTAKAPVQSTPEASTPAEGNESQTAPETNNQTQTPATTDVASAEGSTKFTQRLQQDGTEIDPGPAVPAGANAGEEGKSVAAQTEAGKPVDTAQATATTPAGQAATDAQAAQPVPGQQAAANPATQQVPAGAQKMFLYEERLGQSAPTAIEGNVAWSVKEESPGGDAKPEPVVQAQINVPERGLTALMTIKRNADSSLPASHVIEFVFSLPENFEGGSIDGVQRVSMKRNEQDRGDALIAVPAKITEDFHMIALNDFPEAVATNVELLRSRSWIDIPLTYRNGRRALLTLEKGTAGSEAFTNAMQAWSLVAKPDPAGQ
jgi:hypothetical protein